MSIDQRWEIYKKNRLCCRCLRKNQRIGLCTSREMFTTCNDKHHSLLHSNREGINRQQSSQGNWREHQITTQTDTSATRSNNSQSRDNTVTQRPETSATNHISTTASTNTNQTDRTMLCSTATFHIRNDIECIALRTIPVILCKDGREVSVNCLLDDASTQSYINVCIAERLHSIGDTTSTVWN